MDIINLKHEVNSDNYIALNTLYDKCGLKSIVAMIMVFFFQIRINNNLPT